MSISKSNENHEETPDDLPHVEFEGDDEIEIQKKVRIIAPHISEPNLDIDQTGSDFKMIQWWKVIMLCSVWVVYTFGILTHYEHRKIETIFGIFPSEPKSFDLCYEDSLHHSAVINFLGAFDEGVDPQMTVDDKKPHLTIRLELVKGDVLETLSQNWYFLLLEDKKLEYSKVITKKLELIIPRYNAKYINGTGIVRLFMQTNIAQILTVKLWYDMSPVNKTLGIPLGAIVLIFLYVLIIWEVVDRTFASVIVSTLAIGILAILDARPTTETIMSWVDVETLLLLFGMMILVSILSESGIFDYLAVLSYELSQGNLFGLIYTLCMFTAFFSAFLDNVTMMLLLAPVTIRLCEVCNLNPVPVIISMVVFSNIGAALTPVGDPPNVLIMTNHYIHTHGVNFGNFCLHMLPAVMMALLSTYIHLRIKFPTISSFMNKQSVEIEAVKHEIQVWEKAALAIVPSTTDEEIIQNTLFKKAAALKTELKSLELKSGPVVLDFHSTLAYMKNTYSIRNKVLLIKSSIAFTFVLVLFCLHAVPNLQHLSLGWSALVGAILLLILADDEDIEIVLSRVEWSTLLFFACLFALMEALTELGLIDVLGDFCIAIISQIDPRNRLLVAILLILWVTGIASAFLANIPVTTMMVKIVIKLSSSNELQLPLAPLVWALALGACFGGNGTLIGASANVVSSGVAEQHGYRISFMRFLLFGFPVMINTLIVASFYLFVAHCVFEWH